jgi:hypothetical protein
MSYAVSYVSGLCLQMRNAQNMPEVSNVNVFLLEVLVAQLNLSSFPSRVKENRNLSVGLLDYSI